MEKTGIFGVTTPILRNIEEIVLFEIHKTGPVLKKPGLLTNKTGQNRIPVVVLYLKIQHGVY
jgi:hypothetical protein